MYKIEKVKYQTSSEKMYDIIGRDVTPSRTVWIISKRTGLFKKTYIRFEDSISKLAEKISLPHCWQQFLFNYTNALGATEFSTKNMAEKVIDLMKAHPSYFVTKGSKK